MIGFDTVLNHRYILLAMDQLKGDECESEIGQQCNRHRRTDHFRHQRMVDADGIATRNIVRGFFSGYAGWSCQINSRYSIAGDHALLLQRTIHARA